MPRTISALMAVCVIAVAAPAFAQQGKKDTPSGGPMVFVGYSTDIITGLEGIVGLTQACHGDFGTTARVCTTKEFILSSDIEAPATISWILAEYYDASGGVDYSGKSGGIGDLSCDSWGGNSRQSALVVQPTGRINKRGPCDDARSVTCCAPAQ